MYRPRLYTPRQRRAYRRSQLRRDLILGVVAVALAQMIVPLLPIVQEWAKPIVPNAYVAQLDPVRGR